MEEGDDGGSGGDVDPKALVLLLMGYLRTRVVTHPVSTLGGVAAVGYALGWSLPRVVLRMGGAVMVRMVAIELLEELFVGAGNGPVRDEPRERGGGGTGNESGRGNGRASDASYD